MWLLSRCLWLSGWTLLNHPQISLHVDRITISFPQHKFPLLFLSYLLIFLCGDVLLETQTVSKESHISQLFCMIFFLMTLYSPNGTTFFSNYSDFILKMFFFNRGHVAIKRQSQGNKMNAEFNILFSPRHVRAFWNDLTFILQNIEHSTNCIVCVWLWSFWTSLYLKSHSHGWCYAVCSRQTPKVIRHKDIYAFAYDINPDTV